jgi:hypothetical protein
MDQQPGSGQVHLHAGIGYATPTTSTTAAASRSARPVRPGSGRPGCGASPTIAPSAIPALPHSSTTCPRSPAMLANPAGISVAKSEQVKACRICAHALVVGGSNLSSGTLNVCGSGIRRMAGV